MILIFEESERFAPSAPRKRGFSGSETRLIADLVKIVFPQIWGNLTDIVCWDAEYVYNISLPYNAVKMFTL